MIMAKGYS
jgi:hypothetical protein